MSMRPMRAWLPTMSRALLFLGGPWHGRHADVDGRDHYHVPMPVRHLRAAYDHHMTERDRLIVQGADPDDLTMPLWPAPRIITYHRRAVQVIGWRFPLPVMTNWPVDGPIPDGCVLPGYVHGVPAEHEPLPNLPAPRCTCSPLADLHRLMYGPNTSACYLDHCPAHGPFRPKGTR